ncbi:MAG: DUF4163 domain-containing protein [Eubacterium sp.]|nr:DUF4163 domain-containing protein [Eubacterium sp.]
MQTIKKAEGTLKEKLKEKLKKQRKYRKMAAVPALCMALASIMLICCQPDTISAAEPAAAVGYTMKTEKAEYKDSSGRVRGIVSFEYPQFEGTSKGIQAVNQKIVKQKEKFMNSDDAKSIKQSTEWAVQNDRFYDEYEQYFCQRFCNVTYNKNGIVSLSMLREWYGGGVHNSSVYGLNYNLNTGKKLTVRDVISGNVKKKIEKALKKQMPEAGISYDPSEVVRNRKDYQFYLKDGMVYICFDSYELNQGGRGVSFTVGGKYK